MHVDTTIFSIRIDGPLVNKVAAIKAIRTLTGLGLKEAKDISEIFGTDQLLHLSPALPVAQVEEQLSLLRSYGIDVNDPATQIIDELRMLGVRALVLGDDELANEILQLVLSEKLRRGNRKI